MIGRLLGIIAALAAFPLPAQSPAPGPSNARGQFEIAAQGVVAVLRGEAAPESVFAPSFLADVPTAQVAALKQQLESQFGPLAGVDGIEPAGPATAHVRLRFARAIVGGPMTLAPDGKVAGLLLNDIVPAGDSLAAIRAELEALPGRVSVLYAPLDPVAAPVLAIDPDAQLAIGSTFKLYVLSALAHEIERGRRQWSDVAELDARSLPSGSLHTWPRGAPVTLHTLAALMISVSDNTATDQLIHSLGRAAMHDEVRASGHGAPDRMLPFLTTMELFAFKGDPARAQAFIAASEDRQGAVLEELTQQIGRDPGSIVPPTFSKPTMIDTVEWFASGEDLRRLLARIVALEDPAARQIMAIEPALPGPRRGDWSYVGYKGGSEPGVLNLTWLLQDKAGKWHVLAMGWNDPGAPVDIQTFELLAQRLLALPLP